MAKNEDMPNDGNFFLQKATEIEDLKQRNGELAARLARAEAALEPFRKMGEAFKRRNEDPDIAWAISTETGYVAIRVADLYAVVDALAAAE